MKKLITLICLSLFFTLSVSAERWKVQVYTTVSDEYYIGSEFLYSEEVKSVSRDQVIPVEADTEEDAKRIANQKCAEMCRNNEERTEKKDGQEFRVVRVTTSNVMYIWKE